jgi:glycopeptide antibiotics resistance protein
LDLNTLRLGLAALAVLVTLWLAARQLFRRQRISDIVDLWLYTWTGSGIGIVALEAFE